MLPADDDLEDAVRRGDPDRWLATRFIADPPARADVISLYAFDQELARAERVATNVLIAEIRLAWWREVLDEIEGGGDVRAHPVARRLGQVVHRRRLPRAKLEAMIDGRAKGLGLAQLESAPARVWAERVAGSAAVLAAEILDPSTDITPAALAGEAWGLALLKRAGRLEPGADAALRQAFARASQAARGFSPTAFPALAYVTLARGDLRPRPDSALVKRLRLSWAVASGRL